MKPIVRTFLLAGLAALPILATADSQVVVPQDPTPHDIAAKNILTGSMPCPDRTIYSEAVDLSVSGSRGADRSDRGYANISCQTYQSFDGVRNPIDGVRVFAITGGKNLYQPDNARFNLDSDGKMTKPLRLAVAFYRIGDDGYPGEEIYYEEFDAYGEKANATFGEEAKGDNVVDIYQFTFNLSKKVKMENGYVSVFAVNDGNLYDTGFSLIHDANVQNFGVIMWHYRDVDYDTYAQGGGFNFCFTGDESEPLAQKGLRLNRVLSPSTTDNSPYAKVQVEVSNYGVKDIRNATLSLYEDDELLATERIDETVYSETAYKYTFKHRIDCSTVGKHSYRIYNETPNDSLFTNEYIAFSTTNYGGSSCTSQSTYGENYKYISRVTIGDIDVESGDGYYSDFRDQKVDLMPGQSLTLNVDIKGYNGDYLKVWVDWNGNGVFDDAGEFIGYISNGTTTIAIPSDVNATSGEKTMRIILSNQDVSPCEVYTYGETEDYTINVIRPENSPSLETSLADVITKGSETVERSFSNSGSEPLNVTFDVQYRLPQSPDVNQLSKAPAAQRPARPAVCHAPAARPALAAAEPASTETDPLVLTYGDATYYANTGAQTTYVNYAHYYPAAALKSIKGMKISSIDVFIASAAKKSYVAVWGGSGVQFMNGDELTKQEFTPVENSWNHIVLDNPVTIEGEDLFIGCALEGCASVSYLVGTDKGPANIGYGDLISTAHSNYWWSLADLGYDTNVLIKANVTGDRTPAVSWLTIDKSQMTLSQGSSDKLTLTTNANNLSKDIYEAVVKVSSNDPLASSIKIPVYLDLGVAETGVSTLKFIDEPAFRVSGGYVSVVGDKPVSHIALFTVDGRQIGMAFGTGRISTAQLQHGLYVVKAVLEDGTTVKGAICVK